MKPVFMTHCDISSGVPAEPAESWLHQDAWIPAAFAAGWQGSWR